MASVLFVAVAQGAVSEGLMQAILIFVFMLMAAMVPFWLITLLVRRGQNGLALTIGSVIGGTFAIFFYATGTPIGINPVFAMGVSMLICVPALLGVFAGTLLGWLLRRRDDRSI